MPIYKNEKKGTWYVIFRYTDWTGKRRQKKKEGFKRKADAKQYEIDFREQIEGDNTMLFKNLVKIYMKDVNTRLRPTTAATKDYLINTKLLPFFGDMPLNTIEPATVRQWQNELMNDPSDYKDTYLKTIHNQLSAIFNFAVKYYRLKQNPAAICGSMGAKHADEMNFWTKEEFDHVISCMEDHYPAYIIFNLLFYSGMRIGELLALTENDFDFYSSRVNVDKTYARLDGEDIINDPKTRKGNRVIVLPPFIMDMVKNYIGMLYGYDPADRLFPYTKHYLHHERDRALKQCGVKKIRLHDLRHSHASLLVEMNVSILVISERLGHENIETTLRTYSHLYPNKHEEVAVMLENMWTRNNENHKKSYDSVTFSQ